MDGGLRQLFRKNIGSCDWTSIESAMTSGGIPDCNYCMDGVEGWIEFKKMSGWRVPLRPDQIGWIMRRSRHGGRVFIAARRVSVAGPLKGSATDELWLLRGRYAIELRTLGVRDCPSDAIVGRWMGGPAAWDWDEVRAGLHQEQ